MATPTFTVKNITETSATVTVSNPSGYYICIMYYPEGDTASVQGAWVGNGTTYTGVISGLTPETTYVIVVGYNETSASNPTLAGSTTITTEAEEEEPEPEPEPTSDGTVYLYISGEGWMPYVPYIYIAGEGWTPCTPYIYIAGTGWKPY